MYRYIQFDAVTGRRRGSMATCELDRDGQPIAPDGCLVFDTEQHPDAATAIAYVAETNAFTQPPPAPQQITKADVIALLSPERWAELNRYHPTAADARYRDAGVYWAMSVFHAATRPFPVDDERVGQVFTALVSGGAMSLQEVQTLRQQLAAGARSR